MPHLPYSIELHDSNLTNIETIGRVVKLALRPAYVHLEGKGWRQDADIVLWGAVAESAEPTMPVIISDGTLRGQDGPYHNLLDLPLKESGPARLWLELQSGEELSFTAGLVEIQLLGERQFVEDFDK